MQQTKKKIKKKTHTQQTRHINMHSRLKRFVSSELFLEMDGKVDGNGLKGTVCRSSLQCEYDRAYALNRTVWLDNVH